MKTTIRQSDEDPALVMEPDADNDNDLAVLNELLGVLYHGGEVTFIRNGRATAITLVISPATVETA